MKWFSKLALLGCLLVLYSHSFELKAKKLRATKRYVDEEEVIKKLGLTKIKQMGKGAFGSVLKVKNAKGEEFALKYSKYSFEGSIKLVDNEVNALEALKGKPFILPICSHTEIETNTKVKAIAFPLAEGNFEDKSYEMFEKGLLGRRINLKKKLKLMIEMATAVEAVHEAGLIHRDINMGNFLMFKKHPILADFGMATKTGANSKSRSMSITPSSLPEDSLVEKMLSPTQKTDVFSLGVIFVMMLDSEYQDCIYAASCEVGGEDFSSSLKADFVRFDDIKRFREKLQTQRKLDIEEIKEDLEKTNDPAEKKELSELFKMTQALHKEYAKDKKLVDLVYQKMLVKEKNRLASKNVVVLLKRLYKEYFKKDFTVKKYLPKCPKTPFNKKQN